MEVVLINPQIPQNTGSIARSCAATNTPLNLVGKKGFEIDEKKVRRAGLDYWPYVNLKEYSDFDTYLSEKKEQKIWLISKFGTVNYFDADFKTDDILVFGSETKGLGDEFMGKYDKKQILKIPMNSPNVRSLNLSNAVSIVLYEALKKINHFS